MTNQPKQVYLVGGAVRDCLLGIPVHDRDFMVTGMTQKSLLSQGFLRVGKSFPVFLHPTTFEEYALARTEKKTGDKHTDFSVIFTPNISAKDDLLRRDLTINAMAIPVKGLFDSTPIGGIFDPYGGQNDLAQKKLRHVSDAFVEDPLRILRVARFYAKLYDYNFIIEDSTKQLMQNMVKKGMLLHLSHTRIWQECARALMLAHASQFIDILHKLDILPHLFLDIANGYKNTHVYQKSLDNLQKSADFNANIAVRVALWLDPILQNCDDAHNDDLHSHTHRHKLHHGNYDDAKKLALISKLYAPKYIQTVARMYQKHKTCLYYLYHSHLITGETDAQAYRIFILFKDTKPQQNQSLLLDLMSACVINHASLVSQTHFNTSFKRIKTQLLTCLSAYCSINADDVDKNLQGAQIGKAIAQLRIQKIMQLLANN